MNPWVRIGVGGSRRAQDASDELRIGRRLGRTNVLQFFRRAPRPSRTFDAFTRRRLFERVVSVHQLLAG